MSPPHANITDGYFVRYETLYRWRTRSPVGESAGLVNNMIEWLVDAVSKNGNIELTIHLGPPSLYRLEQRTLRQIGMWLEVNGEAIYNTRPWYDGMPESQTADDIHVRYTTKGDSLYAILFQWPRSRMTFTNLRAENGTKIRMLGIDSDLVWEQTKSGLVVSKPPGSGHSGFEAEIPCDHAYTVQLTPAPAWVD